MPEKLYLDLCNSRESRFRPGVTFFSRGYDVPATTRDKGLLLQRVNDMIEHTLKLLSDAPKADSEKCTDLVEVLWGNVVGIVRQYDGVSAGTTPPQKDSEAPSSAPSEDSCEKQESSSSTKQRPTLSSYGRVGPIVAKPAKDRQ